MTAQTNHSLPTSAERTQEGPQVARNGNDGLNVRISELAESLRAMRRSAQNHWALWRDGRYSITMDAVRLGDLTDAAGMLEQLAGAK